MSRRLLLLLLVGTTPTFVSAAESVEFPKGPPPRFAMIVSIDEVNGRLEYRYAVARPVHEQHVILVDRGGVSVEEVVVRTRNVTEIRQVAVALGAIRIMDREGITLDQNEGLRRLSVGTMVLHSLDAGGVDSAYRKLLAKDSLILVQVEDAGGSSAPDSEDLVLTPENAADHGFWIRCGLWDKKQGSRTDPATRTQPPGPPVVYFRLGLEHGGPLHKGPFAVAPEDLRVIKAMSLVLRDGDAELLAVPLRAEVDLGNEIHLFTQFTANNELLTKLQITVEVRGESGNRTFVIPLSEFVRK